MRKGTAKQGLMAIGLAVIGICATIAFSVVPSHAASVTFSFKGSVSDVIGGVFTSGGTGSNGFSSSLPLSGSFTFNSAGGRAFCAATRANIGKRLAIQLDNEIISAPVVQSAICGGSGIITGTFTTQQTQEQALLLRSGALPATLSIIEERTVGADLGADAIQAGTTAALVGTALVILLMLVVYGPVFGGFASIAMLVNMLLVFAGMSILGASLTLPGIAGLVLTVGMAVDSNVLIYERIKEERRNGRSVIQAMDLGFTRALNTIIDSNVTSLIATVVLFYLGTGPVKGFAVTFAIGIVTTVFTAFTVSRLLVSWWIAAQKTKKIEAPL